VCPEGRRLLYLWPLIRQRPSEKTGRRTLFLFDGIPHPRRSFLCEARWSDVEVGESWSEALSAPDASSHKWLLEVLREQYPMVDLPGDSVIHQHLQPARGRLVGQELDGLRLEAKIASGGFGTIYAGAEVESGRTVAVKVLESSEERSQVQRFEQEYRKLGRLGQHPGIIRCFGCGCALVDGKELPWYSMELAQGGDLAARIEERRSLADGIPWDSAQLRQQISGEFEAVADAVAHLHRQQIIHRDIKPGNVLIMDDGTLRVSDFGLVKNLAPSDDTAMAAPATSTGAVMGTRAYMAPEQARGQPASKAADVYSLGILLAELATGERPEPDMHVEEGSTIKRWPAGRQLPGHIRRVLRVCTDVDPGCRPADAGELLARFREEPASADEITGDNEELEAPASTPPRGVLRRLRDRVIHPLVTTFVCAAAAALIWLLAEALESFGAESASTMVFLLMFFIVLPVSLLMSLKAWGNYVEYILKPADTDVAGDATGGAKEGPILTRRARFVVLLSGGLVLFGLPLYFAYMQEQHKPPSTTNARIRTPARKVNLDKMIAVPAGPFMRGSDDSKDERPMRAVHVNAFEIDKYEVTVAQYKACVSARACDEHHLLGSEWRGARYKQDFTIKKECNWGKKGREHHPINCVSWSQADTYCSWAGKRLPTEAEWEKAARGEDGRAYPWGKEPPSCGLANFTGCRGGTVPVSWHEPQASPYGLVQMAGNVREWVSDWYRSKYFRTCKTNNPKGPRRGSLRQTRGGGWHDGPSDLRVTNRMRFNPTDRGAVTGFRCAKTPPPTQ